MMNTHSFLKMRKFGAALIITILIRLFALQITFFFTELENSAELGGKLPDQGPNLEVDYGSRSRDVNSSESEYINVDQNHLFKARNNAKIQILKQAQRMKEAIGRQSFVTLAHRYPGVRMWNKTCPIFFMHIGKTGGTSFAKTITPVIESLGGVYIGSGHFDWSRISMYPNFDVVLMLRNPITRAVSHFRYSKTLSWTKGLKIQKQTLWEYLHDPQTMLDTLDLWQDGQAAVSWLTGTHIASWAGVAASEVWPRELQALNTTHMCLLAAQRLQETLWFDLLEELERSMQLLAHQLGYPHKLVLVQPNSSYSSNTPASTSRNHSPKAHILTSWERETLSSLMPQDLWLYSYAKLLFEARWTSYKTGVFIEPQLPLIPQPECMSTRFALKCTDGPLSPLYFRAAAQPGYEYLI